MAKNAVPSYESQFFLRSDPVGAPPAMYGVSGIRDWSASYNIPETTINALGVGFVRNVYGGPLQGQLSLTRDLILNKDPVLTYTGEDSFSGTLIYDTNLGNGDEKVFGFNSGYLTNYSVNCGVGGVPTVDSSFVTFGRFGSGIRHGDLDYSGSSPLAGSMGTRVRPVPNQGSIWCGFGQSGTNRVTQVSQNYEIDREPIYDLSQKTASDLTGGAGFVPAEVITNYPIEVTTNMTVEVDDYETANIMDTIRSGHHETISLTMYQSSLSVEPLVGPNEAGGTKELLDDDSISLQDNGYKTVYKFHSVTGQLVSQSVKTSIDGTLSVDLEFKDYLNRDL
jgi:hypothetical protein